MSSNKVQRFLNVIKQYYNKMNRIAIPPDFSDNDVAELEKLLKENGIQYELKNRVIFFKRPTSSNVAGTSQTPTGGYPQTPNSNSQSSTSPNSQPSTTTSTLQPQSVTQPHWGNTPTGGHPQTPNSNSTPSTTTQQLEEEENEKTPSTTTQPSTSDVTVTARRRKSTRVQFRVEQSLVDALLSVTGKATLSDAIRVAIIEYLKSHGVSVETKPELQDLSKILGE